jgi:hypothetical protein
VSRDDERHLRYDPAESIRDQTMHMQTSHLPGNWKLVFDAFTLRRPEQS